MRNKAKLILPCLLFFIIFEKIFNNFDYKSQDLQNVSLGIFQKSHILGTDYLGRDLYARVAQGLSVSLSITILVCLSCLFFGFLFGLLMGYFKMFNKVFMFITETIISIPSLIITLFMIFFIGDNFFILVISLSINRALKIALLVRNETNKVKNLNYVKVCKIMGASDRYILIKHILPNIFDIVVLRMILMIPGIIFSESFLSFIGLGVKLPIASLGNLISSGIVSLNTNPIEFVIPSIIIVLINLGVGAFRNGKN